MPSPKYNVFSIRTLASSVMLAFVISSYAQQVPVSSDEEVVRLSPFAVNESADMGRYQAVEASSGSRIRMDLMDYTQSVSVVTNEFMSDIGTARLLDAVKYVAGIGASTHTNALDVMNVRGFQSLGATIDGFNQFNWINQDPIITERIEVVKGPNAIIAPQGLPGGVVNNVTKRPSFAKTGGYTSYQVGRWDSNRAELDVNYILRADKLALRVVTAVTDADDYGQGEFHQNVTVMPMFTYRFSPTTELTLQFQAYNASLLANNGNPISLYAVGRSNIHLQEGLPRDFQVVGRNITRHQNGQNTRLFLTSEITDKVSMRLVGNWAELATRTNFLGTTPANIEVVTLDQVTGEWSWDGVSLNPNPTYRLGGFNEYPRNAYGDLQNDFVFKHETATIKTQIIGGYSFHYQSQRFSARNYVADTTDYDFTSNYTPPAYSFEPTLSRSSTSHARSSQVYGYGIFTLLDDRLVLSGSLSQNRYSQSSHDRLTLARNEDKAETLLPSGGVVYKITPEVSVYYGFSKQETLGRSNPATGTPPHTIPSEQHEGGVRLRLFQGKLYATFVYFDIVQDNLWVFNPGNYVQPTPNPFLPDIRSNRTSKGFEFEFTWAPTKNFSVVGNYTKYKNRDDDDMLYPNVGEEMGAVWGQYTFSDTGALRGLSVGIGVSYVGERPGHTGGQFTSPPPGFTPVRIQPMFYLPSHVVFESSVSYRFNKNWHAQLVVNNLLDKDYVPGAFNRNVFVSTPINPKLTLRYEF